jgi:hypothetical protein
MLAWPCPKNAAFKGKVIRFLGEVLTGWVGEKVAIGLGLEWPKWPILALIVDSCSTVWILHGDVGLGLSLLTPL